MPGLCVIFQVTALCINTPLLDAMVMLGDGITYGFSGQQYWRMDYVRAIDQMPLLIGNNWFCKQ